MNMLDYLARLDTVRDKLGLSDRALSLRAGLSSDAVRNLRRGAAAGKEFGVYKTTTNALAAALGVSPLWLETGQDDIGLSQQNVIRSPTPQMLGAFRHIKCFEIDAAGGSNPLDPATAAFEIGFSPQMLASITQADNEHLSFVRFDSDAMVPTLNIGDWVLIDATMKNVNVPGIYMLNDRGALRVRRIQRVIGTDRILITPDNHIYASAEIPADQLDLVGRAVWVGRRV